MTNFVWCSIIYKYGEKVV